MKQNKSKMKRTDLKCGGVVRMAKIGLFLWADDI